MLYTQSKSTHKNDTIEKDWWPLYEFYQVSNSSDTLTDDLDLSEQLLEFKLC